MFTKIKPPPPHIKITPRDFTLHMMRSRPAHAEQLIEGLEESLPELRAFMPWAHFENTVESQRARLTELEAKWDAHADFTFNLFTSPIDRKRQEDGVTYKSLRFVGCIGMHLNCLAQSAVEIGYWVRSGDTGKGLCTLATRALLHIAFEHQELRRVKVTCDVNNEGSRRVIEKAGFPFEARLRNGGYLDAPARVIQDGWQGQGDLFLYGMIPEDYSTQPWLGELKAMISSGET